MTTYLTRVVHFSAAHRYHRPEWSEERNRERFGACANPHGHGHNYTLEVMVAGAPHGDTGFSADLAMLDRILREKIVARLDHRHINHAIEEFGPGGKIPTTENVVIWIWEQLAPEIREATLVRLRLREDPDLFVDYFGPDPSADPKRRWEGVDV
ncbi:MAG TPA: 6-carboxytetrahydropterin synthase [Longimicrobiaceae bacterium]|nr:6-carboxytetrahydropterin synthase [Longimicrobiaceae bacterium]